MRTFMLAGLPAVLIGTRPNVIPADDAHAVHDGKGRGPRAWNCRAVCNQPARVAGLIATMAMSWATLKVNTYRAQVGGRDKLL